MTRGKMNPSLWPSSEEQEVNKCLGIRFPRHLTLEAQSCAGHAIIRRLGAWSADKLVRLQVASRAEPVRQTLGVRAAAGVGIFAFDVVRVRLAVDAVACDGVVARAVLGEGRGGQGEDGQQARRVESHCD